MAKNEDKWVIELTYTELMFLKSAVKNYNPSGIWFTEENKQETLNAIDNAK